MEIMFYVYWIICWVVLNRVGGWLRKSKWQNSKWYFPNKIGTNYENIKWFFNLTLLSLFFAVIFSLI